MKKKHITFDKNIISLGVLTKKMIFPLFMGLSSFISIVSYTLLKNISYEKNNTRRYFYGKPFIIAWFMCLAEASLGVFYLIELRKVDNDTLSQAEKDIRQISQIEATRKGKKYLIMFYSFITCLLDCVSIIILCMVRELEQTFYEVDYKALLIVVSTIISIFLLKHKFHFHHFIGGTIIAVGIIAYTMCDLFIPKHKNNFFPDKVYKELSPRVETIAWVLTLLNPFVTGFQENIEKYMMEKLFVSPYKIVFYEGATGFMMITLSFIPLAYIKCSENSLLCDRGSSNDQVIENVYDSLAFAFRHKQFLLMLILIYFSFAAFNIFRVKTNYHFSPSHRAIADILGYFLFFIFQLFIPFLGYREKGIAAFNVIAVFCYFIVFIGVFIVLEIIIIYWSNIDKDTRQSIEIRQDLEKQMIQSEKEEFDLTEQSIDPVVLEM